ncbi:MAG: DUF3108 domain-containing protein [Verrucomicrobiota bacterium]
MSARRRSILLALLLSPLIHGAPAWQGELSSPAPGPFAKLPPTVLDFQVSWNGAINAGRIRMEFAPADARKAGTYVVRSSAASQGAGAVLFPYQTSFWSEIAPASLRPRYFHAVETDAKETVNTTVRHSASRVESEEITKQLKTGVTKQTDRTFAFAPVFDIFSAMLLVRSQKLATGDQVTLIIYPFDRPYLLRVKVQGRELHNGRNSIRLTLGLRKIDRDTLELQPYKKLKRDATLWLSDDADRIPVELRAAAFIGDVRATLAAHRKP